MHSETYAMSEEMTVEMYLLNFFEINSLLWDCLSLKYSCLYLYVNS